MSRWRTTEHENGYKRAVVAIGHKILVSVYHMVSQNVSYNDLGDLYLDKLNKNHLTRNLGYLVYKIRNKRSDLRR